MIIPKTMRLPLCLTLIFNAITYNGSRLLTQNRIHYNFSSILDEQIPFIPWTVSIYLGCYVFWAVNYVIGCRQEEEKAFQFISADLLAKMICLLCFLTVSTTNIRPVIQGTSVWEEVMRVLYQMDAADNLLPSIHCLTSSFCFIAVRKNEAVPVWYRITSCFIALSIYISTLTTKQHILIDVFFGIAISEVSYLSAKKSGFSKWYMNFIRKACKKKEKEKSI